MQTKTSIGAEANNITGVRWNFWLVENNIKHSELESAYASITSTIRSSERLSNSLVSCSSDIPGGSWV